MAKKRIINPLYIEQRGRKTKKPNMETLPVVKGERECLVNGVFGETGVGKSHQMELEIKAILNSDINKGSRKVLIFDTNGEYKHQTISLNNIQTWAQPDCRRVNARGWTNEKKKEGALFCTQKFTNGLLIIDDIDGFTAYNRDQELISLFMGNRHRSVDITVCHQSLEMANPNFWRNATALRLHKQFSDDGNLEKRSKGQFEILKIAELIIDKQYNEPVNNKRFFLNIHLRKKKIYGCESRNAFIRAASEYLNLYPKVLRAHTMAYITRNTNLGLKPNSSKALEAGRIEAINYLLKYYTADKYKPV